MCGRQLESESCCTFQVIGDPGTLPDVMGELTVRVNLLRRLVGTAAEGSDSEDNVDATNSTAKVLPSKWSR